MKADGTKIADRWASQYSWAKKRLLRYAKAIEELSAAEERERVLREALEDIATFGLSKRDREVARAALATPAPQQPKENL